MHTLPRADGSGALASASLIGGPRGVRNRARAEDTPVGRPGMMP